MTDITILHLISSEGYYGAEAVLIALARNSAIQGCAVVVGVLQDSRFGHTEVAAEARRHGLDAELIPCNGRCDWRVIGRIRQLLDRYRVDVLHTHGYKAEFYGYPAARRRSVALVATCHSWPATGPLMRAYYALDQAILRHYDHIAPVAESLTVILERSGVPRERITVIPNGVDAALFATAVPSLRAELSCEKAKLVGFVGRLVPAKGTAVLVCAARTALAAYPEAMFVFVGDGPARRDLQAMAMRMGVAERVAILGTRSDMSSVYASLDVLVLPSFAEAAPMCLLEAMAAGVPVIATPVGDVPKLVTPGLTGLLVEPGDAEALSREIVRLLRDPEFAARLAANGRSHVAGRFSAEHMALRYTELYRQALAGRFERRPSTVSSVDHL